MDPTTEPAPRETRDKTPASPWTDEKVKRLKQLWWDGLRASQIAVILGGVTRNSVIGKVHRLGLERKDSTTNSFGEQSTERKIKQKIAASKKGPMRLNLAQRRERMARAKKQPTKKILSSHGTSFEVIEIADPVAIDNARAEDFQIPRSQRKQIMGLNGSTCRWPIGEPGTKGFFYCGHHTLAALPYCATHCRVAYRSAGAPNITRPRVPATAVQLLDDEAA